MSEETTRKSKSLTLVLVKLERDYWCNENEAFNTEGNPFPSETRLFAEMEVSLSQNTAFRLANAGVVSLVIPPES